MKPRLKLGMGLLTSLTMLMGASQASESPEELTKEKFHQLFEQQDRSITSTLFEKHTAVLTGNAVPRSALMRSALMRMVSPDAPSNLTDNEVGEIRHVNRRDASSSPRAEATLDQACDLLRRARGGVDDARAVAILLMHADAQAEEDLERIYDRAVNKLTPLGRAAFDAAMQESAGNVRFKRTDLIALSEEIPQVLLSQWRKGCERRSTLRARGIPPSVVRTVPAQEYAR